MPITKEMWEKELKAEKDMFTSTQKLINTAQEEKIRFLRIENADSIVKQEFVGCGQKYLEPQILKNGAGVEYAEESALEKCKKDKDPIACSRNIYRIFNQCLANAHDKNMRDKTKIHQEQDKLVEPKSTALFAFLK